MTGQTLFSMKIMLLRFCYFFCCFFFFFFFCCFFFSISLLLFAFVFGFVCCFCCFLGGFVFRKKKTKKNRNSNVIFTKDAGPGPKALKLFSCSTQQSMKFFMLISHKLLTIANSFLLNLAEHENFSANKYENANFCWHFHIY